MTSLYLFFIFRVFWAEEISDQVNSLINQAKTVENPSEQLKTQLASLLRQKKLFYPAALLFNLRARVTGEGGFQSGTVNRKMFEQISDLQRRYEENDSLIYVEEFFEASFFARLVGETRRLWKSGESEIEGNCNLDGRDRMGGYIQLKNAQENSVYNLVYGNEELLEFVSRVAAGGKRKFHPADFPIELREYGGQSTGMMCHKDLLMYADADGDLEIVVTIRHDEKSMCEFVWYDRQGGEHRVRTRPNSLSIVKPNAATHCVSDTAGGSREILKFILVADYTKPTSFKRYARNDCNKNTNSNFEAIRKKKRTLDEL